ncbi:hypothetical protein CGLO_00439 [Colletotrichum gloeosporioides Cg-14]|uniref:Uncharacterized protein n=1 Tax=Colletotrichum gloeosporioides (strain Cg-14) TaxID=1237896 RepID=T0KUL5_COLGC|nr:hypothetical protein CGLO_00439 [Colletotrichum gloeosporioides Cg-14]
MDTDQEDLIQLDTTPTNSSESAKDVDLSPYHQGPTNAPLHMEAAMKPLPPLHELEDLELERLSQLCLPRWDSREFWRKRSKAIRPERVEYAALLRKSPSQAWKRAMQQLQSGFCRSRPLEKAIPFSQPSINKPFLGAMSIILYDIQLQTGSQGNTLAYSQTPYQINSRLATLHDLICMVNQSNTYLSLTAHSVFEHMLLVDYGMEAPPVRVYRPFADKKAENDMWKCDWPMWHALCAAVSEIAQSCTRGRPVKNIIRKAVICLRFLASISPATGAVFGKSHYEYDLALMLHHYHTRRTHLQPLEYWKGRTGYQGILQELIKDVPRVGTERLMRKLSVDFNENIDKFVSDYAKRRAMKAVAKRVAVRHGIELVAPKATGLGTPLIELYYKNGLPKREQD